MILKTRISATLLVFTFILVPTANAGDCDRDCLVDLADDYVAALVAHDTGKAPLSGNIKTVENLKRIKPGEGLWKTAVAGPEEFVIHVPYRLGVVITLAGDATCILFRQQN